MIKVPLTQGKYTFINDEEEAAAHVYDKAAVSLFGEYARPNLEVCLC